MDEARSNGVEVADELPVVGLLGVDVGSDTGAYGFGDDADTRDGGCSTDYDGDGGTTSWGDGRSIPADASVVSRLRDSRGAGAICGAARSMIEAAMNEMNAAAAELDEAMGSSLDVGRVQE